MTAISRLDTSIVGRWWWTIDRWTLIAVGLLIAIGAVLSLAASPAVAERLGYDQFFFSRRQLLYLMPAVAMIFAVSLLSPLAVRRVAAVGFVGALALLVATTLVGDPVNGARRWLFIGGFSLQPSEFVKPTLIVVTAWMLAEHRKHEGAPGLWIATVLIALVVGLLVLQPDIGMALVVGAVGFGQLFLAGMPMGWVLALVALALVGFVAAYATLPHVASRVDRFLDPASGDSYQIDTAIEAFRSGGLFGRGPGEGSVKTVLPDAHTDFIFAVAAEEFGLALCLLLVGLFAFIVLRGIGRLMREGDLFVMLAAGGLLIEFGIQALINMGVTLRLLPTKGMTLPFISYGGSSLLAVGLGMGMLLALTRRRAGGEGVT